jgi:ubiquinone/menaquinone biosynthesis C-methylase UbiE
MPFGSRTAKVLSVSEERRGMDWRKQSPGGSPSRMASERQRLFAWALAHFSGFYEKKLSDTKRGLFSDISGTIIEIGPGTGTNLSYFSHNVRWIGIEPNPFMDQYLWKRAKALGLQLEIRRGTAEDLPAPDSSADAVVSTLVLCSVGDVAKALSEILRVLKPGGRLVFVEHVAAPRGTWLRRFQSWVKPAWKRLGDGCHPDRETWVALERAGFAKLDYSHFRVSIPLVGPQIAGIALKSKR